MLEIISLWKGEVMISAGICVVDCQSSRISQVIKGCNPLTYTCTTCFRSESLRVCFQRRVWKGQSRIFYSNWSVVLCWHDVFFSLVHASSGSKILKKIWQLKWQLYFKSPPWKNSTRENCFVKSITYCSRTVPPYPETSKDKEHDNNHTWKMLLNKEKSTLSEHWSLGKMEVSNSVNCPKIV